MRDLADEIAEREGDKRENKEGEVATKPSGSAALLPASFEHRFATTN